MSASNRAAALVAVLATLIWAGCGGDDPAAPTVDSSALEAALARDLGMRTRSLVDNVYCPDGVEARAGRRFDCLATFDGEAGPVIATLIDSSGRRARFRLRNLLLGKLERAIEARLSRARIGVRAVDCPGPQAQRRGVTFFCRVEDTRGRIRPVRVEQLDDEGNVRLGPRR